MGEKDIVEKYLESYNDIFADIVNGFLFNGEKRISEEALREADTGGMYKVDGKVHETRRDVSKFVENQKIRIVLIGMENQTNLFYLMPVRTMEYDAARYRGQMNQRKDFGKKKTDKCYPVITLVLYFGKEKWDAPTTLKECLDLPEIFEPFVSDYSMQIFDVPRVTEEQVEYFTSDFKIVADYFMKKAQHRNDFNSVQTIKHVDAMLKMMEVLTGDQRFTKIMQRNTKKGEPTMCEVLDEIYEDGRNKGRIEGKIEGKVLLLISLISKKIRKNKNLETIAEELDEDIEDIKGIYEIVLKYGVSGSEEDLYKEWKGLQGQNKDSE